MLLTLTQLLFNLFITATAIIATNGIILNSFGGDVVVYTKYKISKFNKNEIDIEFNKMEKELIFKNQEKPILTFKLNENNLTFDIINKETIKLTLENK